MRDKVGRSFSAEGAVAKITLNRPEKLNAILHTMIKGITEIVEECGRDDEVRAIVITGAGRAFSSGDDIVGGMGRLGDAPDPAVGDRAPHEHHLAHAEALYIGHEFALASQKAGVLPAPDRRADTARCNRFDRHCHRRSGKLRGFAALYHVDHCTRGGHYGDHRDLR